MNVTQYAESTYINAELIEASPAKRGVILNAGTEEQTKFGPRFTLQVELDTKKKIWQPDRDTIKNIIQAHGSQSEAWVGTVVEFRVINVSGKKRVLGIPAPQVKK